MDLKIEILTLNKYWWFIDNGQSDTKKVKQITPTSLPAKTTAGIPGIGVYSDSENSDND